MSGHLAVRAPNPRARLRARTFGSCRTAFASDSMRATMIERLA